MSDLYDTDFFAWTQRQATALAAGKAAELDWLNLAEEIERLGKSDLRQLENRLAPGDVPRDVPVDAGAGAGRDVLAGGRLSAVHRMSCRGKRPSPQPSPQTLYKSEGRGVKREP